MGSEAVVSILIISVSTEDTRIFTGKINGSFSSTAENNNECVHRHVAISTAPLIELYECMPSCVLNTMRRLEICSQTFFDRSLCASVSRSVGFGAPLVPHGPNK